MIGRVGLRMPFQFEAGYGRPMFFLNNPTEEKPTQQDAEDWSNINNWFNITSWNFRKEGLPPSGPQADQLPNALDTVFIFGTVSNNSGSPAQARTMEVLKLPEQNFIDFFINIEVISSVTFTNFNYNYGTIKTRAAYFLDASGNVGTIVGDAWFLNDSSNFGTVTGLVECFTSQPSSGGGCGNGDGL